MIPMLLRHAALVAGATALLMPAAAAAQAVSHAGHGAAAPAATAPATPRRVSKSPAPTTAAKVGTVVVAHGGDSVWNAHVREVAAAARTGGPVEVSFLMGPGAKTARF